MRKVLFYERQHFAEWAMVIVLITGVAGLIMVIPDTETFEVDPILGASGFFMLLISVFVLNLLTMTTWVYEDEVRVQFGRLVPLYSKHIYLNTVTSARALEYKAIRSSGGWGIRTGRIEGETTRILNARGKHGVLLETDEKPWLIGTQFPDKLAETINEALHG